MLPPRNPYQIERHTQTKSKGCKKIFHANGKEKIVGAEVLRLDKIDFKTKVIVRDNEGHYIMIKGAIQREDITLGNTFMHQT